jgi:hypothetical protein
MEIYDYSKISPYEKSFLPEGFKGNVFNMSYKWVPILPSYPNTKPLKIMEIGAYHGANACSLVKTLATHPKSEIHCVDPWMDYDDYVEYKGKQGVNYSLFLNNISKLSPEDMSKVYIHRISSTNLDLYFKDDTFDIIYIDGNHSTYYVVQDAILSLKKLVPGGYLIFDDLQDQAVVDGLNLFLSSAKGLVELQVKVNNCQGFVQKKLVL